MAGLIMLFGHTMHSFTKTDQQNSSIWQLSQYLGGMAPALFLFLTGCTFAFMMESQARKQMTSGQRWKGALRRAGYLLMLAFLFRFQMWAFGWPHSPWTDLLKVDVLNCMGVAFLVLSPLAMVDSRKRIEGGIIMGSAVAFLAPIMTATPFEKWLPAPIAAYLKPDFNQFTLFPWSAFICFGLVAGTVLKLNPKDAVSRTMQWWAIAGFGITLISNQFSMMPYTLYEKSDFWLNSPGLTFAKLGLVLVLATMGYLWTRLRLDGFSVFRLIGTHSLLVYWVHIELVYGRALWFFKGNLEPQEAAVMGIVVILLMIGLCLAWERRFEWGKRWFRTELPPKPAHGD
jgi:uncharacterized membrane protein